MRTLFSQSQRHFDVGSRPRELARLPTGAGRAGERLADRNPFLGEGLASLAQSPFDTRPRLQRQLMLFDKFSHSHLTVALLVYHDDSAICGSDRKRESSICSRASAPA